MNIDITERMSDYRTSLAFLWNTQFRRRVSSLLNCGPLDQFEQIDELLFAGLVLDGHRNSASKGDGDFVIPVSVPDKTNCMPGAHVDGYFQWAEAMPVPSTIRDQIKFEELFDFDRYGELKLEFAKCSVAPFDAGEFVATHVLLPYDACRFSLVTS
jgi:hypothetical protein